MRKDTSEGNLHNDKYGYGVLLTSNKPQLQVLRKHEKRFLIKICTF